MTSSTIAETAERRRTVAVATTGTVLALIAYTTPIGTLAATASALGAGPSGQAWILSSMSCGLAVALLLVCRHDGGESYCATEASLGSSGMTVDDGGGHQMTARVWCLGVVAVVASRSARSGVEEVER